VALIGTGQPPVSPSRGLAMRLAVATTNAWREKALSAATGQKIRSSSAELGTEVAHFSSLLLSRLPVGLVGTGCSHHWTPRND